MQGAASTPNLTEGEASEKGFGKNMNQRAVGRRFAMPCFSRKPLWNDASHLSALVRVLFLAGTAARRDAAAHPDSRRADEEVTRIPAERSAAGSTVPHT